MNQEENWNKHKSNTEDAYVSYVIQSTICMQWNDLPHGDAHVLFSSRPEKVQQRELWAAKTKKL